MLALDRDPTAIAAGQALVEQSGGRLILAQTRFSQMEAAAHKEDLGVFDGIALDIGVSSMQFDQAERGFSFRFDGPLDMRMERAGRSAADLVNELEADRSPIFSICMARSAPRGASPAPSSPNAPRRRS